MGLHVYIYRNPLGDCTNNGISKEARELCVVNAEGPFEPKDDIPAVLLIQGPSVGGTPNPILVPAELVDGQWVAKRGGMFGGNLAGTSDSRFCDLVQQVSGANTRPQAINIHDRFEW